MKQDRKLQASAAILHIGDNNMNTHSKGGFTLIELIITIAVGTVVMILFTQELTILLHARDTNHAKEDISQTARLITKYFSLSGQTAKKLDVTNGNKQLSITGDPCQLFLYDSVGKNLGYAENREANCIPPSSATTNLNPSSIKITSLTFNPFPQAVDAKSVQLTMTLSAAYPFTTVSDTIVTTISSWSK